MLCISQAVFYDVSSVFLLSSESRFESCTHAETYPAHSKRKFSLEIMELSQFATYSAGVVLKRTKRSVDRTCVALATGLMQPRNSNSPTNELGRTNLWTDCKLDVSVFRQHMPRWLTCYYNSYTLVPRNVSVQGGISKYGAYIRVAVGKSDKLIRSLPSLEDDEPKSRHFKLHENLTSSRFGNFDVTNFDLGVCSG